MIWEQQAHSSYILQGLRDRGEQYACSKRGEKANPSQTLGVRSSNSQFHWHTLHNGCEQAAFLLRLLMLWQIHTFDAYFSPANMFICGMTFVDRESFCVRLPLCLLVLFRYYSLTPTCRLNDESSQFFIFDVNLYGPEMNLQLFPSFLNPDCRQGGAVRQKLTVVVGDRY